MTRPADALTRILDWKVAEVAARKAARDLAALEAEAARQSAPRGFEAALRAAARARPALIAEIKKGSPSKGLIRADFDPPKLAAAYAEGGAACLSVLTDAPGFQGHEDYLVAARATTALPCLRKDFMIDPWQIAESRAFGADAILIIMAAVDDALAADLLAEARRFGMDALVETHDEAEMARALKLDATLIGVNNRDLKTFKTDLHTTARLASGFPADRLLVAESGIETAAHIAMLTEAGARAFLVGESLMRQADVAAATHALLTPSVRPKA
jgi:indole-3-glycerol phosphate synthase